MNRRIVVWVIGAIFLPMLGGCAKKEVSGPEFPQVPQVITEEERMEEVKIKETRVQEFLSKENLGAMLISQVKNFAWLAGGEDNHVVWINDDAIGAVRILITNKGEKFLLAKNDEVDRYQEESLKELGYVEKIYKWYEDKSEPNEELITIKSLAPGMRIGSDVAYPGTILVADKFAGLRFQLTPQEIKKYRWLGKKCGEIVGEVCRQISPGMTENQIAALTSDKLMRWQITPTVLLIGVDERIYKYRHALPTDRKLKDYAMVNICAARWGLEIAMTRLVHFGPLPEDLQKKILDMAKIEVVFLAFTRPGAVAEEILEKAAESYAALGYPDEWENHHQGGAIGYATRDWVAFPGCKEVVQENQAFAWNPTCPGAKVEDTFIVTKDGYEIVTPTSDWPMIVVVVKGERYEIPIILVREKP